MFSFLSILFHNIYNSQFEGAIHNFFYSSWIKTWNLSSTILFDLLHFLLKAKSVFIIGTPVDCIAVSITRYCHKMITIKGIFELVVWKNRKRELKGDWEMMQLGNEIERGLGMSNTNRWMTKGEMLYYLSCLFLTFDIVLN